VRRSRPTGSWVASSPEPTLHPATVRATSTVTNTALLRRGLRLEYLTCGWNVAEIAFLVAAAVAARSVALAGFALDSGIEIFASLVVVGQLRGTATPAREHRAVRRIGIAFLALALYLVAQTAVTLAAEVRPRSSPLGIGLLAATAIVMFSLAAGKARTGRALGNRTLQTEAKVTVIDGALAATILVGLVFNTAFGWWWADLVGGAVIIGYGLREGAHALRTTP
jgi:divalent metal cation (Fe/Co/Zn/Cd) transporter